jgi:membrane-associated phospholipid phosphatase
MLPFIGMAAAGLAAVDGSDPVRSRTGWSSVEAGVTGAAMATGLKYLFGRARPRTGVGNKQFNWLTTDDAYGSFPSVHTTLAWAVATPFALEYDMPWLYGVAAVTNFARIGSRQHWASDTLVSSLLGYGIGRMFWQSSRDQAKGDPQLFFDGSSVGLKWAW